MSKDGGDVNNKRDDKKQTKKLDFFSLYEELETDNPDVIANKLFWSRKGNSQKYTCSLCNISVEMSQNYNRVKSSILSHIKDKFHKKKFDAYVAQKKLTESLVDTEQNKLQESDSNKNEEQLVDLDTIYNSFEKSNPVIKTSKQFIRKHTEGRHHICTLCDVLVFNSVNTNEFKYNLWVHLNEESHREKLPNFNEVKIEFAEVINNLSNTLSSELKDDVNFLQIGPVFRFVKCSLCQIAVSINIHRLSNHIESEHHQQRKVLKDKGKEINESLPNRTRAAFRKLIVKIEDKFKKDIKYIHIGQMPGYIICSLCSYVILPTQYYLQKHFESLVHVDNKKYGKISKQKMRKESLKDLMKTLPKDLQGYNIFEENMCGLTCKQCNESIPATSYDLYSHINKERHRMIA